MKKVVFFLIALLLVIPSFAQGHLGLEFGATSAADTKIKDLNKYSISQYSAGLALRGKCLFGLGFKTGARVLADVYVPEGETGQRLDMESLALEVPFQINYGVSVLGIRPFVFAEPCVSYQFKVDEIAGLDSFDQVKQKLKYGLGLGAGLNLGHIQASLAYGWRYGYLLNESGSLNGVQDDIKNTLKSHKQFDALSLTLSLFF